jgi:beta-lactamase class C
MTEFAHQDRLEQSLQDLLGVARVPGMVVAAATSGQSPAVLAWGADARDRVLTANTLFPVASVTKLATALAVLRLVDDRALALDDQLGDHLPEAAAARAHITIRALLCHTSGLPIDVEPELAPYAPGLTWEKIAQACLATYPVWPAGDRVQYSNVGYTLLALVVEAYARQPFSAALAERVLAPLGVEGYLGVALPREPALLADARRPKDAAAELAPYNSAFWRALALPYGGLLTTAVGALTLVRAFLPSGQALLSEKTRGEAVRSHTGDRAGGFIAPMWWPRCSWGLGPELRGDKQPHWAPAIAPTSFGHSGASGCLAWADPTRDIAWAFLGARTADSGWLLRRGAAISEAILAAL